MSNSHPCNMTNSHSKVNNAQQLLYTYLDFSCERTTFLGYWECNR